MRAARPISDIHEDGRRNRSPRDSTWRVSVPAAVASGTEA